MHYHIRALLYCVRKEKRKRPTQVRFFLLLTLFYLFFSTQIIKRDESQSFSVLMPGDQVPKFIAMACPCRPPLAEKVTIEVHKPPTSVVPRC